MGWWAYSPRTEVEGEDTTFLSGKALGFAVELLVRSAVFREELFVGGFGIPEVDGEVAKRAGGIPPKLRAPKMGIASEEPDPGTFGPIDSLKAVFTSWLDFKLPEDYKHRCPIFCSR
jgi:hypothetical protein